MTKGSSCDLGGRAVCEAARTLVQVAANACPFEGQRCLRLLGATGAAVGVTELSGLTELESAEADGPALGVGDVSAAVAGVEPCVGEALEAAAGVEPGVDDALGAAVGVAPGVGDVSVAVVGVGLDAGEIVGVAGGRSFINSRRSSLCVLPLCA